MASSKTMRSGDEFSGKSTKSTNEDLLSSMSPDTGAGSDNAALLDSVNASAAPAWRPTEDGEGVVGEITAMSKIQSDYADAEGNRPWCPVVTIEEEDGSQWRIIGYQAVLRSQLESEAPKVGDTLAVKYFGRKSSKDGKRGYANYGVKVQRA